jgi:hypothetical protein
MELKIISEHTGRRRNTRTPTRRGIKYEKPTTLLKRTGLQEPPTPVYHQKVDLEPREDLFPHQKRTFLGRQVSCGASPWPFRAYASAPSIACRQGLTINIFYANIESTTSPALRTLSKDGSNMFGSNQLQMTQQKSRQNSSVPYKNFVDHEAG